ncbi:hypothetical protein [Chamaesiphon sp.]
MTKKGNVRKELLSDIVKIAYFVFFAGSSRDPDTVGEFIKPARLCR